MKILTNDYFEKDRKQQVSELSGKESTSKTIRQQLRVNKELIANLRVAQSEKEIDIIVQKFTSLHFELIKKRNTQNRSKRKHAK